MNKLIILAIMLSFAAVKTATTSTTNSQSSACPNDEYCASCNGTTCAICVNSYISSGICVAPTTSVNNCYSYSNATTCATCNSGYYLSGNTCTAISVTNCVEVSSTNTASCIACNNGYLPSNGACNGSTKCGVDNCSMCKYSDNSTGTASSTTTSNTPTSTATAVCIVCDNNYSVIANGTCVKEPTTNCLAASTTTSTTISTDNTGYTCSLCARGYYDDGTNDCNTTSNQGSSAQIVATLASVVALLLFL